MVSQVEHARRFTAPNNKVCTGAVFGVDVRPRHVARSGAVDALREIFLTVLSMCASRAVHVACCGV